MPSPTGQLRHDLALARAAVRGEDVVVRVLAGNPSLTRSLLLARLVAGLPPAVATSLVAALAPGLRTYALLGAVGRLERPAPTLAQHARGLAPGGCFLVDDQGVSAVKGRLPRGLVRRAEAVLARGPGLSSSSTGQSGSGRRSALAARRRSRCRRPAVTPGAPGGAPR